MDRLVGFFNMDRLAGFYNRMIGKSTELEHSRTRRLAMASESSHQRKDLQSSGISCMMADSIKPSDSVTRTPTAISGHATPSTSSSSTVEEQIQRSKVHWSALVDRSSCTDEEEEEDFKVSNEKEFLALQRHATWGWFFANFSGDGISTGFGGKDNGELLVGEKFAEGGQAELYEVDIKWADERDTEKDQRLKSEYVLKVFKEGTLLKHVKSQMPQRMLEIKVKELDLHYSGTLRVSPPTVSQIYCGILLKSGRFAFLMRREKMDLRTLIEWEIRVDYGFCTNEVEKLMYQVAMGVNRLHSQGIIHRDLKASNVLVSRLSMFGHLHMQVSVADYECSVGVVGTNFFRAPEILQACKENNINKRPEVFSKGADIYSYGMICYELLTKKLPFEGHLLYDRPFLLIDLVVNQHVRPQIPEYVEDWTRELLGRCWQFDPVARPSIGEILDVLLVNSKEIERLNDWLKKKYGDNYRDLF